ncbi:MAG: peroxiredoxin-like family protein [Gammaproteobacteria bacterium]|nr:peroxiredoxin-like family protein [Gammaproteobacteria bacterium]
MEKLLAAILLTALFNPSLHAESQASDYQSSYEKFMQQRSTEKSPLSEQDMAIMKKASQQLQQQLPNPGIQVGEQAPDFILSNAFGKKVELSEELKKGPVVLVFYRGAWCPFCNMYLHALQDNLPGFEQYGARLITITPQTPDKSAEQIEKDSYPFEVLSDLDNQVMQDYKLYFRIPDDLVAVYKKIGLDIESYNGEGRNELPVPGTFVIDRQGVVRAMHADTDYKKRMEPAAIIEALKAL